MPIYEYQCADCGQRKEHLQKISEAPIASCPACGSASYRKLLSAAGFQLKGSGWYATDFKGGGSAAAAKPAEAASSTSSDAAASSGGPCGGSCACH